MTKNYGSFFKRRTGGEPRRGFLDQTNVTQLIVVVVIGIFLVSIIAGIVGIWVESVAKVQQQVALGVLLLVILISALIPFMLVRRSFAGLEAKDFIFIMLAIGVLVFLLVVTPKIFSLPEIFSAATLELVDTTQSMLGFS